MWMWWWLQPFVLFELFYKLAVLFLLYQIWQGVKRR
jgi:hypothetical protein